MARWHRVRGSRSAPESSLVGGGVADSDAELCFRTRRQRVATGGLAGFDAAQFQHMAARRLLSEIMIEGE